MKEPRRLCPGDRYTVPGGDGQTYRVIRVGPCSAVVRAENRERKEVTIEDHRTGKTRTFTPETTSSAITVSPYSAVRILEAGELGQDAVNAVRNSRQDADRAALAALGDEIAAAGRVRRCGDPGCACGAPPHICGAQVRPGKAGGWLRLFESGRK